MSSFFLYGSVAGFASGIGLRSFLLLDGAVLAILATLGGLCLLGASMVALRKLKYVMVTMGVCVICFSLGASRYEHAEQRFSADTAALSVFEDTKVELRGTIVRDPEKRENATYFILRTDSINEKQYAARVRVSADQVTEVRYGDRVSVEGTFMRPKAFESDLGRTFQYEEYLRAHGISHVVSFADVEVVERDDGFNVMRALFYFKHRFAEAITEIVPEPHASFALGLLLGEKHGLGEDLEEVFRTVGIIHIIVLSGYNLTIVAESLMALFAHFFAPRTRVIIGALSIIAFAVMVGLGATVVRASLIALLVLFARATGRTYAALRALFVAGFAMLMINPYVLIYDPGFQFSFLATLGLILLSPLIGRICSFATTKLGVREYLVSTVATQIMVTPLLLFSIGSVSVISVVANLLILVAVPLAMLLIFIAGLSGLIFGSIAMVVAYPAYLVLSYMLAVAELLARIPYASVTVSIFSFIYVVIAYCALAFVILFYSRKKTPDAPVNASGVFS